VEVSCKRSGWLGFNAVTACIQYIETALPGEPIQQSVVRDRMLALFAGDRLSQRRVRAVYARSGIDTRHSVLFQANTGPNDFLGLGARDHPPSTAERNRVYVAAASELAVRAARKAIDDSHTAALGITHIITVSCTGFFAPGLDHVLLDKIPLARDVRRYHIGFMGCFASFQALQMAAAFCAQEADALVLIVAVELCSLHAHLGNNSDDIVAASVFADGAAAALIGNRQEVGKRGLEIHGFRSLVTRDSQKEMSWMPGDLGFDMVLSSYVPGLIECNLREAIEPLLEEAGLEFAQIGSWAVHPGGRRILDKVKQGLSLREMQLADSRAVLARAGNMSSATILFVLKRLMQQQSRPDGRWIGALAFGPGLSIESALLSF